MLRPLWLGFYALISREFYVPDLYTWLARRMEGIAVKLNVWLRWV
jgi:NADH-quinone oxidoreductase subunit L